MPILLRNIRLELGAPLEELPARAAKRLRVPVQAIRAYAVVRRSVDARDKDDVHYRFHLELDLAEPPDAQRRRLRRLHANEAAWIDVTEDVEPIEGAEPLPAAPVVVGFGPAGMFAAVRLAELGYKPLVLERGRDVRRRHKDILQSYYRDRIFNPESNLLFGEGGAGTYSDGKLYTRIRDPLDHIVLEKLYYHGADPDILIDARPHLGSDRLPTVCRRIRDYIEALGGEVRFDSRVDDFHIENGRLTGLTVGGQPRPAGPVLLAVGHSARDTLWTLARRGVGLEPKPFQIGVRIEHPQAMVDHWQYGDLAGKVGLGAAEYHLVARGAAGSWGDLFSFCMCPGGEILPTNESANLVATNGASRAARRGPFGNAGLVITVDPATLDDPRWRREAHTVLDGWMRAILSGESEGVTDRQSAWAAGPERAATDAASARELADAAASLAPAARVALRGLAFAAFWERLAFEATDRSYRVPAQRAVDFLENRPSDGACETSFPLGAAWRPLREGLPAAVTEALERGLPILDRRMPGFAGPQAILTGPETRASVPVRILRDPDSRESVNVAGLYPIGEGAGYAGGIVSAAIDGIKSADAVVRRYARP